MNTYTLVSESVYLQEGAITGTLITAASLATVFGTWILNKHIRASKVISRYPTPSSLKKRLMTSNNSAVRAAAEELDDSMSSEQYKQWVMTKTSPQMGVGKAILMIIFGWGPTQAIQLVKAGVHASESGDKILNRAENKGRFSNI